MIMMATFETRATIHYFTNERNLYMLPEWFVSLWIGAFEFSNAIRATKVRVKHFGIWWCSKPAFLLIDDKTTGVCNETSVTTLTINSLHISLHLIPQAIRCRRGSSSTLGTEKRRATLFKLVGKGDWRGFAGTPFWPSRNFIHCLAIHTSSTICKYSTSIAAIVKHLCPNVFSCICAPRLLMENHQMVWLWNTHISGLRCGDERTHVNVCVKNFLLFLAFESSPVILLVSHCQHWSV